MSILTPTQQKIYNIVSDGKRHSIKEISPCFQTPNIKPSSVYLHLFNLNRAINPRGEHLMRERIQNRLYLRLVRLISTDE